MVLKKSPAVSPSDGALFAVGAMTFVLFSASAAHAEQPPWADCRPASKVEYDSAKTNYLLRNRSGVYLQSGPIWRRSYWYCHLR
jgi:hypothetical protein